MGTAARPSPLGSEELVQLVRASSNAIAVLTPEGFVTAWNRTAERLYGYSEDEALGRHIDMLVPPDRRGEARELFRRLAAGETIERFETQRVGKDGRTVDVSLTASLVRGQDGAVRGYFASTHEIGPEQRLRERLERSEALLASAQELTAVGSWQFSFADRSVEWSREMFRILGRDPDRFVPSPACLREVPHPEDRDRVRAIIAEAVAERRSFAVHARMVRPDGSERVVEARGRVVLDDEGEPASIVGSVQDVTDAESARRALEAAEERFRTAFTEAPVGMGLLDLEGRYVEVNAALCSLLDRTERELVGTMRNELIHPDDLAEADRGLTDLLSGSTAAHSAELRLVPDGREVWTTSRVVLVRDGDGTPRHFLCQLQDITEERRAQDALRESEARMRSILDAVPALVFIKDLDGRYTLVNQAFAEAGGTTVEAALGTRPTDHIDPVLAARYIEDDARLLERLEPVTTEVEMPIHGEPRYFRTTKVPLVDERGRPYAIGGIAVDVTERRRERDALLESRALLTEAQRIGRVGSWTWTFESGEVAWSEEQFRIYGVPVTSEPVPFEAAIDPVFPDEQERLRTAMREAVTEGGSFSLTYRITRPDGTVRTVRSRGEVVTDRPGGPARMIGTTQDVTREVEREAAIRLLARRHEVVLESVGEGICGIDRDGRTTFANAAATRLLGWSEHDLIGMDLHEAVYHSGRDGRCRPRAGSAMLETARDGRERRIAREVVCRRDGTAVPVELNCHPTYEDGVLTGAVISFRDVSEREAAHRELEDMLGALRAADEERRQLLAHLVTAQEDERRRIAADIHDDSVQAMSAVALQLEAVRARLPSGERRLAALDRLRDSVTQAVGRLRMLVFELAPPELEQGGLVSALDVLLLQLGREAGVEHELSGKLTTEPSADCRLVVYRIAQEAITNIRKHARATRVRVHLEAEDDGVLLRISDDGVGFDTAASARGPDHFGIVSMVHRAQLAGGTLSVSSRPGAGTTVAAWVPDPR